MQTSLKRIADKARRQKKYRFCDLYRMLNEEFLLECWGRLNKNAATGVDGVSYQEYDQKLQENIRTLVESLKRKSYHAKLIRRQYIPKGNGKLRPLGILAIEDKLVQYAVMLILQAIYEQDFLESSYGYRPGKGALDAVRWMKRTINTYCNHVVEADIRGFFDNINHDWMMRMLEQRINDKALLGLIQKWLKAGVMETDGKVIHPITGTPQGGIISPVLANIYMHYVLNLWFEKVVKKYGKGKAVLCVYADDFVAAFRYREDAERFYNVLGKRLGKFALKLSPEKTKMIPFSPYGQEHNETFEFLGFEFRWVLSRKGKPWIKLMTSKKKLQQSIRNCKEWCKKNRYLRTGDFLETIKAKLRGHYNYFGTIGNSKRLQTFYYRLMEVMWKWLNRRSQKRSYTQQGFLDLLNHYNVKTPKIVHNF